ncbi:MAG TPA: hypothetical protein VKB58_12140 [Terriglobales bacterium]|nr:hypothetical protein [Terriglobales bacterium]
MKSKVAMLISVATLALSAIAPNAMASSKARPSARGPVAVSQSAKAASAITMSRNAISKSASSITVSKTAISKSASAITKSASSHAVPGPDAVGTSAKSN